MATTLEIRVKLRQPPQLTLSLHPFHHLMPPTPSFLPVNLDEAKAGNAEEGRAADMATDMVANVVARDPQVVLTHQLNPSPNEVSSARSLRRPLMTRPR
jgi:hypothetical protein